MFWPPGATGGGGGFRLLVFFLGLIWGTRWMHKISTLFCFVHFIVKFNFIFLFGVFLYLSILGRIGASNDIIEELVLLLGKEIGKEFRKESRCFLYRIKIRKNRSCTCESPGSQKTTFLWFPRRNIFNDWLSLPFYRMERTLRNLPWSRTRPVSTLTGHVGVPPAHAPRMTTWGLHPLAEGFAASNLRPGISGLCWRSQVN